MSVTSPGMGNERQDFSKRLAGAMEAKGYAPRPGVLHKLFNSHYEGRSVAFSTVSKWLRGKTLPEQDRLQVLASILGVDPHTLRFGGKRRIGEGPAGWGGAMAADEQTLITAYRSLPESRRQLVRTLIEALASSR